MYVSSSVLTLALLAVAAPAERTLEAARAEMVEKEVKGAGVKDPRVIRAMLATPRHEFVEPRFHGQAYLDISLPIGCQQTISSPFIVAYMTQCLDPQPTDKVLEIGTGSGYQAAVLRHIVKEVYTIEIHEPLGKTAEQTFRRLGYDNVFPKIGDGYLGWPEHAPFDKIIVTCSPEKPPQPLVDQLKEGGRMVIPVGERYQQMLYVFRKEQGQLKAEPMQPTFFVPMTGVAEQHRAAQPDPLNPQIRNGNFESPPGEDGDVSGWFYQRQGTWQTGRDAPQGEHYVSFRNREAGRSAHLLQGLALDGRHISEIEVSAWVRGNRAQPTGRPQEFPAVAISFYDETRKEIGVNWIGPLQGTFAWKQVTQRFRVPPDTREAIIRIGLFGAVGEISFDAIEVTPTVRSGDRAATGQP